MWVPSQRKIKLLWPYRWRIFDMMWKILGLEIKRWYWLYPAWKGGDVCFVRCQCTPGLVSMVLLGTWDLWCNTRSSLDHEFDLHVSPSESTAKNNKQNQVYTKLLDNLICTCYTFWKTVKCRRNMTQHQRSFHSEGNYFQFSGGKMTSGNNIHHYTVLSGLYRIVLVLFLQWTFVLIILQFSEV